MKEETATLIAASIAAVASVVVLVVSLRAQRRAELWARVAGGTLADAWNLGAISTAEVGAAAAAVRPHEGLLIDSEPHDIEAWERHGGLGYLFRGGAQAVADLGGPLRALAAAAAEPSSG